MRAAVAFIALAALASCKSKSEDASAATPSAAPRPAAKPAADPNAELPKLAELAKNGPDDKAYPQADSVVASDRDDITLGKDGTVTEHHKSIVRILQAQRGKGKFADVHIEFDQKRQTLDLGTTRTITEDGTPHAPTADEIGEIVPPKLADATIYSDVRERVVSFPAVDKGSVVELEYTRNTKGTPDSSLGGELMLGQWDPILSRTVTITAPLGVTPKLAVEGIDLKPTETTDQSAGTHTYTFQLDNQPDRHPESGSMKKEAVLPRLVYGFQNDWKQVVQPLAERYLSAAIPSPLPDSVVAEAHRIVESAKTDKDKALALFKFVTHDVRSVELPLGWAGYTPHAPDVVLANRYADERDKVGLLLAMCAAEKLPGKPVFVRSGKVPVIPSVPTVAQFDRVLAKLSIDGKDVWLDPADDNAQYALAFAGQDNLVMPLDKNGGELGKRPPLDPSTSVAAITASYALSPNGDLEATYDYALSGWYADAASETLRPLKGENKDRFFAQEAGKLAAGGLDKGHDVGDTMSVEGGIKIGQKVAVPGYSQSQGNFRVFELPEAPLHFASEVPSGSLTTRKYPMWIGTPRTETADISVTVPAGWKVAYVPPPLKGAAEGLKYDGTCEASGQTIKCHNEIVLDRVDLPVDKYAGYHEAMAKLNAYERRIVLLTKAS
jgi:transglutaminase-like putative cysteine protease